mgnify:CR=1 FL=1
MIDKLKLITEKYIESNKDNPNELNKYNLINADKKDSTDVCFITSSFKEFMNSFLEGGKLMLPAILILTFAWTLNGMTNSLGAKVFIAEFVNNNALSFVMLSDLIIFAE